jgi:SAM-dependent methyltransferase
LPRFKTRSLQSEMMDDFAIDDHRLRSALEELPHVNRWLGGYGALFSALDPYLAARREVSILDIGAGIGDYAALMVERAERRGCVARMTALDANVATLDYARDWLDRRLPPTQRGLVDLAEGDATALPFPDNHFDLAVSSMTLHHFNADEARTALSEMNRVARDGIIVNDLQRHRLAYAGIRIVSRVFPFTEMVRSDGPVSVLRGFHRSELEELARSAGLPQARVRWRWAFRWVLSTVEA